MKDKPFLTFLQMASDARDSQLVRKSALAVLHALILRTDPKRDYSCFPSLELLSRDTGLDLSTVKRAAKELRNKELVTCHQRFNMSLLWYVNVRKLQGAAKANRVVWAQQKAETKASSGSPYQPPEIVVPKAEPVAAPVPELAADAAASPAVDETAVAAICSLLWEHFGDHPVYEDPNSEAIMARCVEACIAITDSPKHCKAVLKWKLADNSLVAMIGKADRIGGYIQSSFRGWWEQFQIAQDDVCLNNLLDICNGEDPQPAQTGGAYCEDFPAFLRRRLGANLLRCDFVEDGSDTRFRVEITDAAKVAVLLGSCSGRVVAIDQVPDHVDASTVNQVKWAVENEPWSTALSKAEDPLQCFLQLWDEIALATGGEDEEFMAA